MYRGQAHFTTSDTEVLAYEIISERLHSDNIEDAVMRAARKLKGGYASIIMSPHKLIGIHDPQGIKPLVIGKKENTFILASESAAVEAVGGKLVRDIEPGELIVISGDGLKSVRTYCGKKQAHCIFEYIYFARSFPQEQLYWKKLYQAYRTGTKNGRTYEAERYKRCCKGKADRIDR